MKASPPYYAVIFSSERSEIADGYAETAEKMVDLAKAQDGFLGYESFRNEKGQGVTISYWESEKAIKAWKLNSDHYLAQQRGKIDWYKNYRVRICKVEEEYSFRLNF